MTVDLSQWREDQLAGLVALASEPDVSPIFEYVVKAFEHVADTQSIELAQEFSNALIDMGYIKYTADVVKSLAKDVTYKAVQLLEESAPNHNYQMREGDDDHPRYWYLDEIGNYVRYTNAPDGHPEASKLYGPPDIHPSEPVFDSQSEYFTPDGMKLDRAPHESAEWNTAYNKYDVNNLWAARWLDPVSGSFSYSYVDADIRRLPKLNINRENALFDARIPALRQYVSSLYNSINLKDQMTAVFLSLLDQGRMRVSELCSLTAYQIVIEGTLITIGLRRIIADYRLQQALSFLIQNSNPMMPLFAVPQQQQDGTYDPTVSRLIGVHYITNVLELQGVNLNAIQTYHATMTFSREVNRLLSAGQYTWDEIKNQAVMSVALEWGHDLVGAVDAPYALQMIEQTLIDPVVLNTLFQNASQSGTLAPVPMGAPTYPKVAVPIVSLALTDRTEEEMEFSTWLHQMPLHEQLTMDELATS